MRAAHVPPRHPGQIPRRAPGPSPGAVKPGLEGVWHHARSTTNTAAHSGPAARVQEAFKALDMAWGVTCQEYAADAGVDRGPRADLHLGAVPSTKPNTNSA